MAVELTTSTTSRGPEALVAVLACRDGARRQRQELPAPPHRRKLRRQAPAGYRGRLRLGLRLAQRPSAPLLTAGMIELRSLLRARCPWPWPVRSKPVSQRGHGRDWGTWTEGAVILGRREAPACSGGGRSGADGERNNVQGWTVFEIPSTHGPWGPCEPSDQARAFQIGR